MSLSIADRLALIYTSAGSMRKVAGLTGLSHQQVSRILHNRAEGRSNAYYEKSAEIQSAVEVGYSIHKDLVKSVARAHGLPYRDEAPVYVERLPLSNQGVLDKTGRLVFQGPEDEARAYVKQNSKRGAKLERVKLLGDRVGALHLHWLTDAQRNRWIAKTQKTGKYYSASVGSKVNLPQYVKTAAARINEYLKRGNLRTEQQIKAQQQLKQLVRDKVEIQRVFTPYTPLDPQFPSELVLRSINQQLEARHAPAVGEQGTALADQVLLQVDTRKQRDAADKRKARGSARSGQSRDRKR